MSARRVTNCSRMFNWASGNIERNDSVGTAGGPNAWGSRVTFERPDTDALVRERLRANANDPDALFVLAALHVRDGDVDRGLSVLDRVLRVDPHYPGAWMFKAKLHWMRGDARAAERARRTAEATDL